MRADARPITAQALVELGLRRGGDREAVRDNARSISFRVLADRSARLANCLLALGAGPTRPVAVLVGNCAEYIEVDVAAIRAGVPRVGLGDRLSPDEWRYILEDSQAVILIATAEFRDRLGELPDTLESVIVVGGESRNGSAELDFESVLAAASPVPPRHAIDPAEASFIMYTSGTTGRPKGAWLSHEARAAGALNMLSSELHATPRSAMVHVGPLTHGSGSKVLPFLAAGGRSLILDRFDTDLLADAVLRGGGTHTFMVPTMIHRLVEADPATLGAVRELQQISYGGAPIAPVLFRTAIERLGPRLLQVYGSSEAPHPITLLRPADYLDDPSDELLMSAGYPAFAAEVRTVADDGSVAATGELQVRAAHVMSGYWRNPEATQAAFTEDGWYATGDLASMDELGLVTFRDRKRDLIISGGMNVYPSEVERVLHDHPAVSQAVVVGCPDEEWGESVFAYVVARSGTPVTERELTDWVRDRLAGYKKPRYYEFRSELPMGSTQKVLRNVLRDELWVDRDRRV